MQTQFSFAFKKAGLENREFKLCHGARKLFKSALEGAGMKSIVVEKLLGHSIGLDANYYRPSVEQLAAEYVRYQYVLFIDQSLNLLKKNENLAREARSEYFGSSIKNSIARS